MSLPSNVPEDESLNRQIEQDARQRDLTRREADVTGRAEGIAEDEKRLDEAKKALGEASERGQQQLDQRRRELDETEDQLLTAVLAKDDACAVREKAVVAEHIRLEGRAGELHAREAKLMRAEAERDGGFTEARRELDVEIHAGRRRAADELVQLRQQGQTELQKELAEESGRRRAELVREIEAEREVLRGQRRALEEERARDSAALTSSRESANRKEAELVAKEGDLDYRQRSLDALEAALESRTKALDVEVEQRVAHRQRALSAAEARLDERRDALNEEVEEAVVERNESFAKQEEALKAELSRLRGKLQSSDKFLLLFEGLKRQLGGRDAEEILADLAAQESAILGLKEKMAEHTPRVREELDRVRAENDRLLALVNERTEALDSLQGRMRGEETLQRALHSAQDQSKWLKTQRDILDDRCNVLTSEIERLRSAYQRTADRADRIREIEAEAETETETPGRIEISTKPVDPHLDEIAWLERIEKACGDYGLRFHPRILRAFHTSLKTAEWSPLTVLAGVSGTGKSELPRLYAHFGGMTFKSLPVQPNWDSQESMLGFFNSIDNKFDAQPVLKLLARSQKPWTEAYHGLQDSVVIILLDEMNLAHAELYFAEFLSKLELRRGTKGNDPALDVKLGTGLSYPVPLGRNVLWTGTMNQDETTKSLSDKVLDRSIVIQFPRPNSLERRKQLKQLPPATSLLPRSVWERWWVKGSAFSDEEIREYKEIVESINEAMSSVGRAIGHRVWQSVEYYMANYPDTRAAQSSKDPEGLRAAMRIAFEDQLVQKIMPKLRGIETRGRSKTSCLDKVRALLVEHQYHSLIGDFDLSCEVGYGQFMWQTSSFLQEPKVPTTHAPVVAIP
jgi:hypothetical protein